jgi:hypothetical protein
MELMSKLDKNIWGISVQKSALCLNGRRNHWALIYIFQFLNGKSCRNEAKNKKVCFHLQVKEEANKFLNFQYYIYSAR